MNIDYDKELAKIVKSRYPADYFDADALPKPYIGESQIRGIVIGTDPTYSNNNGKFKYVFGLEDINSPFYKNILQNLNQIGLSLENIYVQNLIKSYFTKETSNNPNWEECALLWLGNLKRELDAQFDRDVPLFITAEIILKVVIYREHLLDTSPESIYSRNIVFRKNQTCFGRNVVALFRHYKYELSKWPEYSAFIKSFLPV